MVHPTTTVTMKNLNYLLLALLLMVGTFQVSTAQNNRIKKADKLYEGLAYPAAIRLYKKGLKDEKNLRAMERLADSYKKIGETGNAEKVYAEITKMSSSAPINQFYYGQMLKSNGKYNEARNWFESYLQTGENPKRAATFIESCDYAMDLKKDSSRYEIQRESFNVSESDFGPVLHRRGLLYTSSRARGFGSRFINMRDREKYFYDIYNVERNTSKKGYKVRPLKGKVNTKFHEGPGIFSPDGNTLYFTRSNFHKGDKGEDQRGITRLKIFSATQEKGKWKNVEELPFNDDKYSCGHPALSSDGTFMVFSSDIPGGFGGTDLYISRYDGAKWGIPTNLGSEINTLGDEQFPYLHPSGTLFFSSDGHAGMGGLDIYASNVNGDGWGTPKNAGYPMNSSKDDFGVAWNKGKPRGYFSSNRTGNDDIYTFKRQMMVKGTVVDSRTGEPIEGARVSVLDASNKEQKFVTGEDGVFSYPADWGKEYLATVNRQDYIQTREKLSTKEVGQLDDLDVKLPMERDMIFTLSGNIKDAESGSPLEGATVRIIAFKDSRTSADASGNYFSELEENTEYTLVIRKPGYVPQLANVSTVGKKDPEDFIVNASLQKGRSMLVEGRTFVRETYAPLAAVNVRGVDLGSHRETKATASRTDGRFWMVLDPTRDHYLIGSKQGYFAGRSVLPAASSFTGDTTVQVEIPMVPYEIGAVVKIIYYDYNQSNITNLASMNLYEIIYFLMDNPEASVDLSSFTDSRGGDGYNQKLSQRRSDAAVGYITDRGISSRRIKAKGMGETGLVNACGDNAKCSEEMHSLNRRTEIRVTELDLGKVDEPWKRQMILDQTIRKSVIVK